MLAKQQASVILEKILRAHDQRSDIVTKYSDTIASFKQKKDKEEFLKLRRQMDEQFKGFSEDIGRLSKDLQRIDAEGSAKVRERVGCHCVCVRERDRQTDRQTYGQTHGERQTERDTQRDSERVSFVVCVCVCVCV